MRFSTVLALAVATVTASPALASYAEFDARDGINMHSSYNHFRKLHPARDIEERSDGLNMHSSYNHFRKLHPARDIEERGDGLNMHSSYGHFRTLHPGAREFDESLYLD
ncbi:hypothetical protein FOMPIDRAFT_1022857 [Fomitopsis schrenkii]|uniref:Uncharacterized protein n=1 Tax=Fomitopsis schrenkii TaxID=2126942 RepID=S8EH03_FOMSC|nr:hypothetical protein FOMPIDRAFT_1022857 [Fomitopsis schrenkii]